MSAFPQVPAPRSLDHFVVSVRDLDAAAASYQRLGFHVLPRMKHIEIGSSNHIIQFEKTYLELVGDLEKSIPPLRERMMPRFEAGEGLSIVSLTSTDLEADHAEVARSPFDPAPIITARRKITMPDGREDETDSRCFYVWRDGREYLSLFYSHHGKPHTIFTPEYYTAHRNTALGVDQLVYVSREPAADREYFETLFGGPPLVNRPGRLVFLGLRSDVTEVLSPSQAQRRFPRLDLSEQLTIAGFPIALRVRVADLERAATSLANEGVVFDDFETSLVVGPSEGHGVVLTFAEGEVSVES